MFVRKRKNLQNFRVPTLDLAIQERLRGKRERRGEKMPRAEDYAHQKKEKLKELLGPNLGSGITGEAQRKVRAPGRESRGLKSTHIRKRNNLKNSWVLTLVLVIRERLRGEHECREEKKSRAKNERRDEAG